MSETLSVIREKATSNLIIRENLPVGIRNPKNQFPRVISREISLLRRLVRGNRGRLRLI